MSKETKGAVTLTDILKAAGEEVVLGGSEFAEYAEWLGLHGDEAECLEGMKKWEAEAFKNSAIITVARQVESAEELEKMKGALIDGENAVQQAKSINADIIRNAAVAIGSIIANRIIKGDYGALNVIGDGLANLKAGRDFKHKPKAGRAKNNSADIIADMAFRHLQKEGIESPSQSEVLEFINANTSRPTTKDKLCKSFDRLGLKGKASDAREALSQAGKRKRKRT